jgi:hypothetical protein
MSQTVAALLPTAVDYERTLVLAIEVSNKSWVLAAQVPGLPHTKAKRTIDPELSDRPSNPGCAANAEHSGRSEGTSPLFGMALRRRLYRVVPFSWSSPVPECGTVVGINSRRM